MVQVGFLLLEKFLFVVEDVLTFPKCYQKYSAYKAGDQMHLVQILVRVSFFNFLRSYNEVVVKLLFFIVMVDGQAS